MQNIIEKVKNLLVFRGESRSVKAKKNVILLFLFSGFNFLFTLLLVPLTLHYLGPVEYGIWVTLSSVLMWFGYFDFGIGNGLRNKLAESLAKDEHELSKTYVSTAYVIFALGILVLWIIFFAVFGFINWTKIFNAPEYLSNDLSKLIFIVFLLFSLQFLLKLLSSIVNADQRPAVNGFLNFITNFSTVVLVWILSLTTAGSIYFLGLGSSLIPVIVFLTASIILFSKFYKRISPSLKWVKLNYSKDLVKLGFQFFVIQIAGLILFATDNMIITQIFGPADVKVYNIAYRYFFLIAQIFTVVLTPFWSAVTEAYVKEDYDWLRRSTRKILNVWIGLTFIVILMIIFSNFIYSIWVGNEITVPISLSIVMGIFVILFNWTNVFAYFINGIGKIKLQFYSSIFIAIANIPLSIYLAKYLNMGITGVMTATCICISVNAIWSPIQYKKIINKTAAGIWAK